MMSLNVISNRADPRIRDVIERKHVVSGRQDLEQVLAIDAPHSTLDLLGHSNDGHLELGDWVVDDEAAPWFRIHANSLRRFNAVRLLGCHTAASPKTRRTICMIADILGIEVYGSTGFLFHYHHNAAGFDPAWRFLLVPASDIRYGDAAQRSPIS